MSNLEMIWSIWEGVCSLHVNTTLFYMRHLGTWAFVKFSMQMKKYLTDIEVWLYKAPRRAMKWGQAHMYSW